MKKNEKQSLFASFKFKIFLLVAFTIIASSAITFGFFYTSKSQSGETSMTTTCFDIEFTEGNSISLENASSMPDASGQKTEPYTFTVKNKCENETSYAIILSTQDGSFSNDFVSFSINGNKSKILSNTLENRVYDKTPGYTSSYIIERGSLQKDEIKEFNLRLWINARAKYEDVANQPWNCEVKVVSGIKEVEDLKWLSTKLPTLAKSTTPTFTEPATTDEGVYKLNDDDGVSYYYRGSSNNNYMSFAGMYWRIIRMNGDGTLRIMYDGTIAHANSDTTERIALENIMPLMEGADKNIETTLKAWYQENIVDKNFSNYVQATKFCTSTKEEITNPTFKCSGNTETKNIGLLTVDELILSGATMTTPNTSVHTFRGSSYWLETRKDDSNLYAYNELGSIEAKDETTPASLVPVINIKADYVDLITGSGTKENPYVLN